MERILPERYESKLQQIWSSFVSQKSEPHVKSSTDVVDRGEEEEESSGRVITLSEVSRHWSEGDCWVVIADVVYNVTDFIRQHPGGEEIILENGGSDVTSVFEDVGHSEDARQLLLQYRIGVLHEDDRIKRTF